MLKKQEILKLLNEQKISYEITEHKAVFSMEEVAKLTLPYPEANAKNIFIRDDKKHQYFLITVKGDKRVNLKEFRKKYNTRPLSFASERDLLSIMGLEKGAVTPLGLLNDLERKIEFYLDESFLNHPEIIGVHPNENTATIWINSRDLLAIVREHGNVVHVVTI